MGWASAGEIFDPVARALIDCGASDVIKREVLGRLIRQLQDGDWDTEDSSLDAFADDPVIVELFYKAGVGAEDYSGEVPVRINWLAHVESWELECDGEGEQCGPVEMEDGTPEGHDRLVHLWARHLQEHHGGDGQINRRLLINR